MSIAQIIHYVITTLEVALPVFIVIFILRGAYYHQHKNHKKRKVAREIAIYGFIFYLLCLFQITAFRFGLGFSLDNVRNGVPRVSMTPLTLLWRWVETGHWWLLTYNVLGNCAWFVPLGILVPALFKRQRKLWKVVCIGASTSLFIEMMQFYLRTGVTDIDDVILNALGAAMGYIIFKCIKWLVDGIKKVFKS